MNEGLTEQGMNMREASSYGQQWEQDVNYWLITWFLGDFKALSGTKVLLDIIQLLENHQYL